MRVGVGAGVLGLGLKEDGGVKSWYRKESGLRVTVGVRVRVRVRVGVRVSGC